jgi:hypothetical protein
MTASTLCCLDGARNSGKKSAGVDKRKHGVVKFNVVHKETGTRVGSLESSTKSLDGKKKIVLTD